MTSSIEIRPSTPADRPALERLAALDSRRPLRGPALVAEVDGDLVAAVALESGAVIADPFRLTAGVVRLLELRAGQVRAQDGGDRAEPLRTLRPLAR